MGRRVAYWLEEHEALLRAYEWLRRRILEAICRVVGHRVEHDYWGEEPDTWCSRCDVANFGHTLWWWIQDLYYTAVLKLRGEA